MNFIPRVIDISRWTQVDDMKETANAGIWGIICKATQGISRVDPTYDRNRKLALEAGLLWGAYHFNSGDDPHDQVDWFLEHAKPDDATLVALDYERNEAGGSNMSADAMVEFLRYGEKTLGRKFVIYSGNYLKESITKLSKEDRIYVCQHKLWLAHYSSNPKLPIGFERWFLHQYSGDGVGPEPHSVPGLGGEAGGLDMNRYNGETREQLTQEWAALPKPVDESRPDGSLGSTGKSSRQ